jgi:hypothetical protein
VTMSSRLAVPLYPTSTGSLGENGPPCRASFRKVAADILFADGSGRSMPSVALRDPLADSRNLRICRASRAHRWRLVRLTPATNTSNEVTISPVAGMRACPYKWGVLSS